MAKKIKKFLIRFGLPILTVAFYYIFRHYLIDMYAAIPVFTFIAVFGYIHTVIGGFWSGIYTTILFTAAGAYIYIQPLHSFLVYAEEDVYRINLSLFTGFFVTFVINAFIKNQKVIKKTSSDLDKTTKRLRRVMDSIYTMVNIVDRAGNILETNKSFANNLDLEVPDLVNKSIYQVQPWCNSPELTEKLRKAIAIVSADNPVRFETSVTFNDKVSFVEVGIAAIAGSTNSVEDIVITVRDRTDKKLYEDELLKSKEVLARLIDSNVIGMAIADLEGEFIETNDEFLNMLGYTPNEFEENGLSWQKITPPEYVELDQSKVKELNEKGFMTVFEKEYINKEGKRIAVIIGGVMINSHQVLCLILDLTPQKNLQRKKDEFIGVASHELKTPMTVIKGYLQLLSKKLSKSSEDYSDFLNIIDFQLDKLNTLVNELHDITKIESNKLRIFKQEMNINELVQKSISEVKPFTETHTIELVEEQKDIYINADIIRLEQVLINLLTNAIKYSPDGGKIIVKIRKDSEKLYISVQDFGLGISDNNIKNIFKKFFQVDENSELREGLGLGLYISYQIVKQHEGLIKVESTKGAGSTFTVILPL